MPSTSEINKAGQTSFGCCQTPDYEPVAICGVGLYLPDDAREAILLPEQYLKDCSGAHERSKPNIDGDDVNNEQQTSYAPQSMESKSTDGDDTIQHKLLEVVYQALEDGGETQYRGHEARVGLFLIAASETDHLAADDDDEDRDMLSLVSEKYDLHGSR
jgi:hypothetical protein